MHHSKFYAAAFALVIAAQFTSCKKHDSPAGNNPATTKKLTSVGDAINNNQFQYDLSGNVSALNIVTDSTSNPYTISYINGIAAKVQSSYYSTVLSYADGRVIKRQVFDNPTNTLQSMALLSYTNGNVSEEVYYEMPLPSTQLQPQLKFDFETTPGGDITKASIYLWDNNSNQYVYQGINEYQYDSHSNPIYALKNYYNLFITIPATPHNIVTETTYDFSNTLIGVINYSYKYDANGNPLRAKRTDIPTNRPQEVSTVTYTYQ